MTKTFICVLSILSSSYLCAMEQYDNDSNSEQEIEITPLLDDYRYNPLFNADVDQQEEYQNNDADFDFTFRVAQPASERNKALPPAHNRRVCLKEQRHQKKINTSLFRAVWSGNINDMEKALNDGASINAQNGIGSTPLAEAFAFARYDKALFLIKRGADISGVDKDGYTYLHKAVDAGHLELVQALCNAGADPHAKTYIMKWTPLFKAQVLMRNDILKVLRSSRKKTIDL